MSDIPIQWKKITRGLPKIRRHANDRAPTIEEIQQLCEYPDRRIKGIVYTMASSGIRLGAWDYLHWKDIQPIERQGKLVAAKIIVYAGDDEEYFSFITAEAYNELQKWMQYRQDSGEEIHGNSWVMRQLWDTKKGYYHHGTIKNPEKLKSSGLKRLMEDALWTQGLRKKSGLKRNRYEFQTDHGLRKWFKTRCELSGMKSINIEVLMGHSIGISDSYYKITEDELLREYLKASNFLIISNENQIQTNYDNIQLQNLNEIKLVKGKLYEKENQIEVLNRNDQNKSDAIAALADKINELVLEIELLKKEK
jgi:integrase